MVKEIKENEDKDDELKLKMLTDKQIEGLKKQYGNTNIIEYFIPNFGYVYFRYLNFGELNALMLVLEGAQGGALAVSTEILGKTFKRIITDAIITPVLDLERAMAISELILKQPSHGITVLNILAQKSLVSRDQGEFREI